MKNINRFASLIFVTTTCLSICCVKTELPPARDNSVIFTTDEKPQIKIVPTPDVSTPDGWVEVPPPRENSREDLCAGSRSDWGWRVETVGEKLQISQNDEYDRDEQIVKLPPDLREVVLKTRDIGNGSAYFHIEPYESGWLAGLDAGEWGGRLTWFSADGNQKVVLLSDNVVGIARVGKETLILTGISHISLNEGEVSKIIKDENGDLQVNTLVKTESTSESFVVESNESILVALTNKKIVRVKTSGEIETWREMPNYNRIVNMVRTDSGTVYLGTWMYVIRYTPTLDGIREQWFVPRECQKFKLTKGKIKFDKKYGSYIYENEVCTCESGKYKAVEK